MLNELKSVLRSKFGVEQRLIDDFMGLLHQVDVQCRDVRLPRIELHDKDDLPILGAAILAKAEVLVTGDKKLLDLGCIEDLQIISPGQFWEKLKAQQQRRTARRKPRRSR